MPDTARVCKRCPTVLSRYNTGSLCGACELARGGEVLSTDRQPRVVRPRRPGRTALPRNGYRPILGYLEETRARLIVRDGTSDTTAAFDTVIDSIKAEAARR